MRAVKGIWYLSAVIGLLVAGCSGDGSSRIDPPESIVGGRFGSSVAASGSLGVIGSPGSNGVGSVYVYDLDAGPKVLAEILPEVALEGDDFGSAVGLAPNLLVVGAPLHEHEGFIAGAAFVYHRDDDGAWYEDAILVSDLAGDLDYFGSSLAVGQELIVIGSPGDDERGSNAGAVFVFGEPDIGWALQEKLTAPDAGPGDRCGSSVAMFEDRIVVGCPHGFGSAIGSGSAYLFRLSATSFVLEREFSPPSDEVGQLFGSAVGISERGVFVGAPGASESHPDGSVHIFSSDGASWQSVEILSAGDQVASRGFGAVLNLDDDLLVVGAQRMEGEHLAPGSAYVFGLANNSWTLATRLRGNDIDRADGFGSSVAVQDGHVLVGAAGDAQGGSNAGSAYHFVQSGTDWK